MILFFVAIILSNYLELRNKLELTTTALARISANKSKAITQKWINLLCMKPPIDEGDFDEKKDKDEIKPSHSEKCNNFKTLNYNVFFLRFQRKRSQSKIYWSRNHFI